jgi:hypothetical protein
MQRVINSGSGELVTGVCCFECDSKTFPRNALAATATAVRAGTFSQIPQITGSSTITEKNLNICLKTVAASIKATIKHNLPRLYSTCLEIACCSKQVQAIPKTLRSPQLLRAKTHSLSRLAASHDY